MAEGRPNILIVMVDQMQAQLLDPQPPAHAAIDLPHLTRLRNRSFQLKRCYCPAPICTPTRASFQLGLSPQRHGVLGNDRPMPADRRTLADWLNNAGYATRYVGKWHLDTDSPRGWGRLDKMLQSAPADRGDQAMADIDAPHQGVAPYDEDEHLDGRVLGKAQDELRELSGNRNKPFALMTSFYGPHAPYYLPRRWHERFDPQSIPLPEDFDAPMDEKPQVQRTFRCRSWGERWSEDKWRQVRAAYFGYCAMIDHFVGRLLQTLEEVGAAANTAVLFLSDHGENNGHRRMIYKGPMMYEQLVRIPALLSLPGQQQAAQIDGLTSLLELPATLASIARAAPSHDLDGIDLLPALQSGDTASIGRPHVVSEFHEANWVRPPVAQRVAMIRDARFKYVYTEGQGEELYDLDARPTEVSNLINDPQHAKQAERLRRALSRELAWVSESLPVKGNNR